MVSLFDICQQEPKWSHISTGVPSLDSMISVVGTEAVIDFQSTPLHNAMFAAICNMMITQLENSEGLVVVLETFNQFPWSLFTQHPRYRPEWHPRIKRYYLPTFAQVLSFFLADSTELAASTSLYVVVNFHEIMEHYKYQLYATFEEALLKLEIDKNAAILDSLDKENCQETIDKLNQKIESFRLLKESPWVKYQNHTEAMFKHINLFLVKHQLVVLLLGCMDVKRKTIMPNQKALGERALTMEQSFSGHETTFWDQDAKRLIFEPTRYDSSSGNNSKLNLIESKITHRIIFYNDWLNKSNFFIKQQYSPDEKTRRMVAVAKHAKFNGAGNIYQPIYFDFNDIFYGADYKNDGWLIDLLQTEDEDLSNFLEQSILSTQQLLRPSSERVNKRQKLWNKIPSSPIHWNCHETDESSNRSSLAFEKSGNTLVIDESDVELTGTLLDDIT